MDAELLLRLGSTAVLVVLPTVLFLGLWRGLMALRDDVIVDRLGRRQDVAPRPSPVDVIPGMSAPERAPTPCVRCGRPFQGDGSRCENCR
ncbi:hypothetical protein G9464_19440 [Halostella sp. JP-L12]|uniref:hypothetical protein n=1 Tax=Halostella TaxID=1843185 RepID=UPI000EF8139D|nr:MULTISPECIES: hypothetical protein [Halostella]NHN49747.1 hypothetical protein [Halostella sp. JP-L12]